MSRIVVIDTTAEMLTLLRDVLEDEGHTVVTVHTTDVQREPQLLIAAFATFRPHVGLYDIAMPYEANWQFFHTQVLPESQLLPAQWIVTTTSSAKLHHLILSPEVFMVIERPFHLIVLIDAVQRVLNAQAWW